MVRIGSTRVQWPRPTLDATCQSPKVECNATEPDPTSRQLQDKVGGVAPAGLSLAKRPAELLESYGICRSTDKLCVISLSGELVTACEPHMMMSNWTTGCAIWKVCSGQGQGECRTQRTGDDATTRVSARLISDRDHLRRYDRRLPPGMCHPKRSIRPPRRRCHFAVGLNQGLSRTTRR